jgi:hypothetical protein
MNGIVITIPAFKRIEKDDDIQFRRGKLENVSVNEDFEINKVKGNYEISIGANTQKITGEKEYIIKYTYDFGKDKIKGADEFYFDIIGGRVGIIGKVTFSIEMPKEFSTDKLHFYVAGSKPEELGYNVSYQINDKTIYGSLRDNIRSLRLYSDFSICIELPEGYFSGSFIKTDVNFNLAYIIPLICFGITFLMWISKDKVFIKTKMETLKFGSQEEDDSSKIKMFNKKGISKLLSFGLFVVSTIVYVYIFVAEYTNSNKIFLLAESLLYLLIEATFVFWIIFLMMMGINLIIKAFHESGRLAKIIITFIGIMLIIFSICIVLYGVDSLNHLIEYGSVSWTSSGGGYNRDVEIHLKNLPIIFAMLSQSNYMIAGLFGRVCSIATFVLFILILRKQKINKTYKGIFR